MVTGAAHTTPSGCPTEDRGKHWVRKQGLESGWDFETLEGMTNILGRGGFIGLFSRLLALPGALKDGG